MTPDRPLLGILLMLGFCVAIPFSDACAKLLGARLPLFEIVLARFAGQCLILVPLTFALRLPWITDARSLALTALRSAIFLVAMFSMFLSLRYLPLADAVAIAFVMPFLVLALAWAVTGEEVGPHRLAACGVGFLGTLLIVQPNFAAVGAPALLPLGVALCFAVFMMITRSLRGADPIALQATTSLMVLPMLLPIWLAGRSLGLADAALIRPTATDAALLGVMAVVGTLAHLLMTWSLRLAPAATLAPMQYLEIPVAALVGWLIFDAFPNGLALAGILVTIAAGLYILWRERIRGARPSPAATPPAAG